MIRGTAHKLLCFCCIEVYLWGKRDTHFLHLLKSVTIPFTVNAGTELLSTRLQHETTDESAQFLHYACLQCRWLPLQLEDGNYLFDICLDLNISSVMYAELLKRIVGSSVLLNVQHVLPFYKAARLNGGKYLWFLSLS